MFISCIMPTTCARRAFIPRAVECYLSQTWKETELVVVDDGETSVIDLFDAVPNLVYVRFPVRSKIGRKRNIANEHAAGDVIAHWDDDDWYSPERLESQSRLLAGTGKAVTGYRDMLFWDGSRAFEYKGAENYACGTSLMYRKNYWAAHRFPDVQRGEDSFMVYRTGTELITESGRGMIVASIHMGNTAERDSSSFPEIKESDLPELFLQAGR